MKNLLKSLFVLVTLMVAGVANAQSVSGPMVPNNAYTAPQLDPLLFDFDGDSRTRDIYPVTCNTGTEAVNLCGYRGTNWFVVANALAGQRYKINLVQAIIGTRSDQYLAQSNIAPMLASNAGNFVIGYPAINDLTPLNGANYVNTNGVTVTPSNVANVIAAQNILPVVRQAVAKGKRVILLHEPGNPSISNSAIGVSSFTGSISGTTLTVTASTTNPIYTPQTVTLNAVTNVLTADPGSQQLTGAGITAGTLVTAQLTGTDGSACPAPVAAGTPQPTSTCTGGIGTYSISNSLTISSEAMAGRYALTSALFDLNSLLDAMVGQFGAQLQVINNNPALQNFAGSTTAINFKAGINIDGDGTTNGTHFNNLGGYYGAISFNSQFQAPSPGTDLSASTPSDISGTNARSLIASNMFFLGSASGGSNSNCGLTGTVPTGFSTACGAGTTAINISAPATDTNQLYGSAAIPLAGNSLTIAITASAADLFRLFPVAPNNGFWNLTDYLQGNWIVSVANGSSKCRIYSGIDYATNLGTRTTYDWNSSDDVASGGGSVDGPTTAYGPVTLRTPPAPAPATATSKSFVRSVLNVSFSAAGSCTITVSRPSLMRVRNYNAATGTFSGWLLMRDLDPAANDNSPAWLLKAG